MKDLDLICCRCDKCNTYSFYYFHESVDSCKSCGEPVDISKEIDKSDSRQD